MFKKIILSVLAIFTMCSTVIPAFADENIPTGIDINGIPPIPHRAPKKPVSPLSTYLNVSTNSFFIVFNNISGAIHTIVNNIIATIVVVRTCVKIYLSYTVKNFFI